MSLTLACRVYNEYSNLHGTKGRLESPTNGLIFHFNDPVWQVFGEKLESTRRYACKKHPLVLYPDDKCGGKCDFFNDSCELVSYPRREDGTFYPAICSDENWKNYARLGFINPRHYGRQASLGKPDDISTLNWPGQCALILEPFKGDATVKPLEPNLYPIEFKCGEIYQGYVNKCSSADPIKYVRLLNNWVEVKSVGKVDNTGN